jgi:hypothetical protein
MLLLLRGIQECRRRSVQQLEYREEEWCIEGTWLREHKRQKKKKHKECEEDTDADRATQCSRTLMRPVRH